MTKRPNPERLAELEKDARAVRILIAMERSPALREIKAALRCLDKAQIANKVAPQLSEAEAESVASMSAELLAMIEVRGDAQKATGS